MFLINQLADVLATVCSRLRQPPAAFARMVKDAIGLAFLAARRSLLIGKQLRTRFTAMLPPVQSRFLSVAVHTSVMSLTDAWRMWVGS